MNIRRNGRYASLKFLKALTLFSVPLVLTCFLTNQISKDKETTYQGQSLDIQFSKFSPAYAAFEDEFMFNKGGKPHQLQAGVNNQFFLKKTQETLNVDSQPVLKNHAITTPITIASVQNPDLPQNEINDEFDGFSGLASFALSQSHQANDPSVNLKVLKPTTKENNAIVDDGEYKPNFKLNFGPMVASVDKKTKPQLNQKLIKNPKIQNPGVAQPDFNKNSLEQNALKDDLNNNLKVHNNIISGPIELRDGLAFVGSMEVSWVIDDQEVRVGSINTPDATYEINVDELIGDIIISLYDDNDDLIGEGIANLSSITNKAQFNNLKVNVRPIDWDKAGEVIHVHSINSHDRPIKGAEVQLYAYNDSVETNDDGEIHFIDWKKSNSRTLAMASKEGFRDSIFLIDSKKFSKVLLFQNKYIDAFFSWIENLGINDVKDMGTVYGAIVNGNQSLQGYQVRLEQKSPLYFDTTYFASNTQSSTGKNGLFAFTGIQDGDYELFIEKDGLIIDRRIVPVEQGKISPLFIDLKRNKKRLEFFDPHNLNQKPKEVAVQFFDGEDSLSLNSDSQLIGHVVGGSDPSLIDYVSGTGAITSTFVTRQRGFERVAVLNKEILNALIESKEFLEKNGLAVGYIQSNLTYRVSLEESLVKDILYFNAAGNEIDPNKEPAYGFILHGFTEGLHTLSVESIEDNLLIMTDLIFSDQQSISIIHSEVESL